MPVQTKFTAAISVDTWDANYRWRKGDELRDRTIEATWQRVAHAIAWVEPDPPGWERRFVEACRDWRMIPDARLLQWAGTGHARARLDNPRATLNLAAFIAQRPGTEPDFDQGSFEAAAALALRFLDDATLACAMPRSPPALCVGMMGFGDALALLGCAYTSEGACEFAGRIGEALSRACADASLRLARERGPWPAPAGTGEPGAGPGSAAIRAATCRHARTTAIHSQYLIARLANDASDALDPCCGPPWLDVSRWQDPLRSSPVEMARLLLQQLRLRGCMQRWIDVAIDYPLVYSGEPPDPDVVAACRQSARRHHLAEPRFRRSERTFVGLS